MDSSTFSLRPIKSLFVFGTLNVINSLFSRIVITKFFFDYPIVISLFNMALLLSLIEFASYISLHCFDGISLPFFPFFEKFIPILVVIFYLLFLRKEHPSIITLAILVFICFGSALASVFEVSFDLLGLIYSFGALAMQSASLVLMEKVRTQMDMSVIELIYLNTFNCLCLFLIADIVQDELRDAYSYFQSNTTTTFYVCFFIMIITGSFVHSMLIYCVATTNTLNTTIAQNCSSSIQTFIAYLLSIEVFYDSSPTFTTFFGIIITIVATILYLVSSKDKQLKPFGKIKYNAIVQHE